MSLGGGGSGSKSNQNSGVHGDERGWFNAISPDQFNSFDSVARQAKNDPGGLDYQGTVDKLLPMGRYGQSQGADNGIMQLGRDLFSSASSNRAQRGFNTPYNLEGVLGDSMRMASSQLIPQANQFAQSRAQMAPALRQASFGYGSAPMQVIQNLLNGTSLGNSKSFGFNFEVKPPVPVP